MKNFACIAPSLDSLGVNRSGKPDAGYKRNEHIFLIASCLQSRGREEKIENICPQAGQSLCGNVQGFSKNDLKFIAPLPRGW
jgi:hypothetical protein